MGLDWCLVRCECGHSFGHRKGAKAKCTICGSNEVTNVQQFSDSRSLANAVADANLPKELAKELSSRLEYKSAIEENRQQGPVSIRERVRSTLRNATDEQGVLRITAIRKELDSSGLDSESWESIIGGAELEGILVRCSTDSWRWV
tara:strand:+ start:1374 stop:1811 length:438 start_codon:yes stop_codon:yes gene_type:complete